MWILFIIYAMENVTGYFLVKHSHLYNNTWMVGWKYEIYFEFLKTQFCECSYIGPNVSTV